MISTGICLVLMTATPLFHAELGKPSTQIGEPLWLKVTIRSEMGDATLPATLPLPEAFKERSRHSHSVLEKGGITETHLDVELMPFSVGQFELGPFPIEAGSKLVGHTQTVSVVVSSAFGAALPNDPAALLSRMVSDPGPRSVEIAIFPPEGLLVLMLIAGAVFSLWGRRKKKSPKAAKAREVIVPADKLALAKLDALAHQNLLESDRHDAFFTALSEIVRTYLGSTFGFAAVESTRSEILQALEARGLDHARRNEVDNLLKVADLAKFAQTRPENREGLRLIETARTLVESTRVGALQ